MTEPTIDELRKVADAARITRFNVKREREDMRNAMLDEIERQIGQRFGARVAAAIEADRAAQAALDTAVAAEAVRANADMPTCVLVEWAMPRSRWGTLYEQTGKRGRYEIRTPESRFRGSSTWGRPAMGERFIRLLKKDGSPGLGVGASWTKWLPEGETP